MLKRTPYVSALLAEVFRFRLVVDALPHATTADVMIDGNLIKKGYSRLRFTHGNHARCKELQSASHF